MNCPKCHAAMDHVHLNGIEVDRCSGCKGMWFDTGELDAMRAIDDSEMLDLGSPALGQAFNGQHDIDCPRCEDIALLTRRINGGSVTVEQCPRCRGSFLDAGEFTAYKYRGMFAPLRNLYTRLTA
ncbi:MAG TPA: zf-TFIIB domain-containing protein [Permianibacter sp.]|nr:zf-TFIIB domain-containing protein [Permianibacter sp.]